MPDRNSDGFSNLARANRRTRSAALVRAATELYVLDRDHDRDQNRRFEELLVHLLPDAAEPERRFVAERLANSRDVPTTIVMMLARDTVDVARPMLERSRALGTPELLEVIAATGPDHHRILAERAGLPEEVRLALAASMEQNPTEATGFLTDRPTEEPEAAILRLAQQASIASNASRQSASEVISLEDFLKAERPVRIRAIADLGDAPAMPGEDQLRPAAEGLDKVLTAAQVIGLARGWKVDELTTALAEGLSLPRDAVAASIEDQTGEALAVLLRALRLDDATAQQVFLLMSPVGRDVERFFRLAELYSGLATHVADTLVARWRGEQSGTSETWSEEDAMSTGEAARRSA